MLAHAWEPSSWEAEEGGVQLEAILSKRETPCLPPYSKMDYTCVYLHTGKSQLRHSPALQPGPETLIWADPTLNSLQSRLLRHKITGKHHHAQVIE